MLVLGSLALSPLSAQQTATGVVSGKVQNATNGAYMENVVVTISGTNRQTKTNSYGEYEFTNVPTGEVTLTANYVGEPEQTATVTVMSGVAAGHDFTFRETESTVRKDGVLQLDPLVVNTQRYQNARAIAIAEERNSINIKNVVSIDQFGNIPSGNVGEFVKFLPGVQIDYGASNGNNQGYAENDANGVSVRGFGPEDTAILIDGLPVAATLPGNLTRQVGLDQLSINNASRVELIKVATPDMPANSVGGQINLITKNAFEYAKANYAASVFFNFNDAFLDIAKTPGPINKETRKVTPGIQASVSYPFSKTLGASVTVYKARQFNQSYRAAPTWNNGHASNYELGTVAGIINAAGQTPSTTNQVLTRYQVTDNSSMTDKESANFRVDWRPTPNQLIRANVQYSTYETGEAQRRLDFRPVLAAGLNWNDTFVFSAPGNGTTDMTLTTRDRIGDTTSAQVQYELSLWGFKLSAAGSHSKSVSDFEDEGNGHFSGMDLSLAPGRVGLFGFSSDGIPSVATTYTRTTNLPLDYTQLANWSSSNAIAQSGQSHNEKVIQLFKIDIERPLDFLPFLRSNPMVLKFGARRDSELTKKTGRGTGYGEILRPGASFTVADILDTDYLLQSPGYGLAPQQWGSTYKLYEIEKARDIFWEPDIDEPTNRRVANYNSYLGQQKDLKETIDAYYAQVSGTFFNNRLAFVGGARQENKSRTGRSPFTDSRWDYVRYADGKLWTDPVLAPNGVQTSIGNGVVTNGVVITQPTNRPLYANNATATALRAAITSAGLTFPSIPYGAVASSLQARKLQGIPLYPVNQHVNGDPSYSLSTSFKLTKKIDLKAAFSRSFKLQNLESGVAGGIISGTSNFTLNEYLDSEQSSQQGAQGQITVANPSLKPETSKNWDFEASYYTDSGGKLSVSYYTKDVTNQVQNFSTYSNTPIFDVVVTAIGLDPSSYEDWRVVTSSNSVSPQKTSGWEFEVRQDFGVLGRWGQGFSGFFSWAMTDFPPPNPVEPFPLTNPDGSVTNITPSVTRVTIRSDRFGGAGLQYSGRKFTAQLRGTYRNESQKASQAAISLSNGNVLRVLYPAETRIDLNFSYILNKNYSLFASARDVFKGERDEEWVDEMGQIPSYAKLNDRKRFGTVWTLGVNGTW